MTTTNSIQQFLFTGDIHGNVSRVARFVFLFKQLQKQNPNAISVFSGDFLGPTIQSSFTKGDFEIQVLKKIYSNNSVIALGNHDFDYGEEQLEKLILQLHVPIVVSNIQFINEASPLKKLFRSHYLFENNSQKFVFMGLLPYEMKHTSDTVKSIQVLNFLETIQCIENKIHDIQNEFPNENIYFVLLSHLGVELDKQLVKKFRNVLILGGHSHTVEPLYVDTNTGSALSHAGYNANYIGCIGMQINKNNNIQFSGELFPVLSALPEDFNTKNILNKINLMINQELKMDIHKEVINLNIKSRFSGCDWDPQEDNHAGQARYNDTFITRIMADAMVDAIRLETGDSEYIGLFHGGGVRSYLPSGVITVSDIHSVLPFPQYLVTINVTGKDLLIALELGVGLTNWGQRAGLLHPSSRLVYSYDINQPRGSRLRYVLLDQQPLDINQVYKLVTNNWVASGKDGQEIFLANYAEIGKIKEYKHLKQLDVFSRYLQAHKQQIANEEIVNSQEVFGRRIIASPSLDEARKIAKKLEYARGKEKMLSINEIKLDRFIR